MFRRIAIGLALSVAASLPGAALATTGATVNTTIVGQVDTPVRTALDARAVTTAVLGASLPIGGVAISCSTDTLVAVATFGLDGQLLAAQAVRCSADVSIVQLPAVVDGVAVTVGNATDTATEITVAAASALDCLACQLKGLIARAPGLLGGIVDALLTSTSSLLAEAGLTC